MNKKFMWFVGIMLIFIAFEEMSIWNQMDALFCFHFTGHMRC